METPPETICATASPRAMPGWRFAANSHKSSATLEALTSGKRYWFRVTAEGTVGPGPRE